MIETMNTYSRGLRFVRLLRSLNSEMPMQQADILLTVARKPGTKRKELIEALELTKTACSRNLAALASRDLNGREGLGLIDMVVDPRDGVTQALFLTPKGKKFVTLLLRAIDDEFSIDAETDALIAITGEEVMGPTQILNARNVPLSKIRP